MDCGFGYFEKRSVRDASPALFAGASGNVATEDVLQLLEGLGVTRIGEITHIVG